MRFNGPSWFPDFHILELQVPLEVTGCKLSIIRSGRSKSATLKPSRSFYGSVNFQYALLQYIVPQSAGGFCVFCQQQKTGAFGDSDRVERGAVQGVTLEFMDLWVCQTVCH